MRLYQHLEFNLFSLTKCMLTALMCCAFLRVLLLLGDIEGLLLATAISIMWDGWEHSHNRLVFAQ